MVTTCYDELRRRKRRPTVPLDGDTEEDDPGLEESLAAADPGAPDPQLALEQLELEHAIQHCLDALPVEFRAAVILADMEGVLSDIAALRAPHSERSRAAWHGHVSNFAIACGHSRNFYPPASV